jgi:uncharacterized membrane protein
MERTIMETGRAQSKHLSSLLGLVLLAGVSGARSMLGVAALSRELVKRPVRVRAQPARALAGRRAASATAAFAAMEIVGDKMPGIPNRTDAGPLTGRAMSGALVGAAIGALSRRDRTTAAMLGAASAVVGARLSFHARHRLSESLPPLAAALVEDAILVGLATLAVATLDEAR